MTLTKSLLALTTTTLLAATTTTLALTDDQYVNVPYKLCGKSLTNTAKITVKTVQANVWPPVAGKKFDIIATGSTTEDITGGTYHLEVSLDDLQIIDKKGNLGDYIQLPVKAGDVTIKKSVDIPSQAPDGDVKVIGHAFDEQKAELLCVEVDATLGGGAVEDGAVGDESSMYSSEMYDVLADVYQIPDMRHDLTFLNQQYERAAAERREQQAFEAAAEWQEQQRLQAAWSMPASVSAPLVALSQQIDLAMQRAFDDMRAMMNSEAFEALELQDTDVEIPFSLCGDENDPIQITSMKADKWPLQPGTPLTLTVTADILEDVTDGTYEAKVLFDGLQVIDKKDTLKALGVELPLKAGKGQQFSKKFDVPKNIPSGDVQMTATAASSAGKELVCTNVEIHV